MRVVKFLLKSALILAGVAVVGALIAREALLWWGASKIKTSLAQLRKMETQGTHFQQCQDKGSRVVTGDTFATLQLRFVSSTEYVTEILCSQFSLDPIEIDRQSLPPLVKKVPGSSGVIWGADLSGVAVEVFGRQTGIGVENQEIISLDPAELTTNMPISTCAGYGFECCAIESQQGTGQQLTGVTDCPRTCYSQCLSRPVVLSFTTSPFYDPQTRILDIQSGQSVEFHYVIDGGQTESLNINLSYGDNQVDQFNTDQGEVRHQYQCAADSCIYTAQLRAEDERGVTSADLSISQVQVRVRP